MNKKNMPRRVVKFSQCLILLACLPFGAVHATLPDPVIKAPDEPVIFLHGLGGDPYSWLLVATLLDDAGWEFGGILSVDQQTGNVEPIESGDFYVVAFSDNQGLTLAQQGDEVSLYVDAVLAENPTESKVTIVGHSMGVMAARAYLQWSGAGNKVSQLIAVGAPHGGSELATFAQQACVGGALALVCELLEDVLGIDPYSVGVSELRPDSQTLGILNDLNANPLPADVYYTSIIGFGTPVIGVGEDGDGVISSFYQNLGNIPGVAALDHFAIGIDVADRPGCDPGFTPDPLFGTDLNPLPNQTHTCETTDEDVVRAIMWTVLSGPPAATDLILTSDPLIIGQAATIVASGADPGEEVYFGASVDGAGENAGPCLPPEQGAVCMEIINPVLLGQAVADENGIATLVLPVDAETSDVGLNVWMQAIILRGAVPVKTEVVQQALTN